MIYTSKLDLLVQKKSDAYQTFVIQILPTDIGTEYFNQHFKAFLGDHGIIHESSCPNTPQKGIAERKSRHILETTRAIMFGRDVPKHHWMMQCSWIPF